jgi:putative aldouronate transport system substrate-binding protein
VYDYFGEDGWAPVRQLSSDGKIYFVPGLSPKIGVRTGFIRKDWLDRVGLEVPTTRDELLTVYRAFRDQDANGNGDPNDEIPVSGREGLRWLDDLFIMHGVEMFEGHPRWSWDEESGQMISHQVSDQMKDALIFIRQLVEEGLMDPVMPVQQNADWTAKLNSGRIGHYFHLVRELHKKSAFMDQDPNAEWVPLPLIAAPGVEPMRYPYPNANYNFPDFAISANADNPEAIMQWFNWSKASDDALFYLELGIPGVHWERSGDGTIEVLDPATRTYKYHAGARNNVNIDEDLIVITQLGETKAAAFDVVLNQVGTETLDDDGMPVSLYGDQYDDFRPGRATLFREVASKIVLGIEPISAWDAYVEQWYALGGDVMTERATEWYRTTKM